MSELNILTMQQGGLNDSTSVKNFTENFLNPFFMFEDLLDISNTEEVLDTDENAMINTPHYNAKTKSFDKKGYVKKSLRFRKPKDFSDTDEKQLVKERQEELMDTFKVNPDSLRLTDDNGIFYLTNK